MKHFILALTLLPLFTFCGQQKEKEEENKTAETVSEIPTVNYSATYYLIRHAEKVRTNPKDSDPSLDIKGMMRAKRWATYFEPIKIDAIYITRYIRTKQTISLIAQQKAVSPKQYDPNAIYSDEFLKETNGQSVLIVGHSNTIPQLVNNLIGEEKFTDMDDSDNSTLFKVTINGNDKKVETITVE
ncbi:phosphohistidine phosphatase SixA [Aequorivita sublithincola DSM 14238]|uniref:Phosphohistidine phosphatase SixA n=1 Tax=Aequorivita sublithincola (strain DSM 14238 / LMG 21431 / ACAM 643 / 9-3) TaxID=746697 RepID=I3Z065_AEQSU|nr:phosphoglycerate mutase family protein [Aequorivita sublithincola]AFL82633.1 phosphohistidine phosphatase SixA [Aequorivita sublithincola DSM 14238]